MTDYDSLRQELIETDEAFRSLFEEHQELEERLTELSQRSLLSLDDEMEEKRIKIHKLRLKDQMETQLQSRLSELEAVPV